LVEVVVQQPEIDIGFGAEAVAPMESLRRIQELAWRWLDL
jgi:hypothetical protein